MRIFARRNNSNQHYKERYFYNMINHFSDKVSQILAFSREEASRLSSDSICPEHLLLAIIRERSEMIENLFNGFDVNRKAMKLELEDRLKNNNISSPMTESSLQLDEKASNILKLSVLEARKQNSPTVNELHLILAILHDQAETGAKDVLEINNLNYDDAIAYVMKERSVSDGIGMAEDEEEEEDSTALNRHGATQKNSSATKTGKKDNSTPVLDNFSFDLTKAAAEGKLDTVVGREKEIQRVIEILGRRKKNNPILIGEPGVGKSAIVEGLAQLIVKHLTSPTLYNKRVVSLDMTSVVAGTKYRGQFEERIKALIRELENNPDIIIFIDEIHTIIGAGSAPGSMDAANIMKPALARGTIQCIGATTLDEYRTSIEKDGALERRFQKVMVDPTTPEQTLAILNNVKGHYEKHHHVKYTDEALKACVRLTERYVSDRAFPDKAIDAMDEVGSKIHLQNAHVSPEIIALQKQIDEIKDKKQKAVVNQNFELAAGFRDKQGELEQEFERKNKLWANGDMEEAHEVNEHDVAEVVAMMTGIPVQKIAEAEGIRLKGMSEQLKRQVIAQDKAIDKIVKAIQRNRVGLKDPNHPIGAFMFLGPTGVGKTYLAKKLSEFMFGGADSMIRIDMSEYTESFNVSRLVGAPPGYVGYDEGGQLTERVRRHPYSIVLLDEIEKAHGNVFNLLLQVLDEGRLTDGNGRLVDFRNTVIIMTSNAGTRQLKEFGRGVGFNANGVTGLSMSEGDKEYARSIIQKSLSKQFSPEFLNRLDEIITFDQLDLNAIKKIIDLELKHLFDRIESLGYHLHITDTAKEFVATKGYDVQFGARPLKRAIQTYIEDGVCEKIINGELKPGATINIGKSPNKDELTFR